MAGIVIKGGSGNFVGDNVIVGFEEAIIVEESRDNVIVRNYASSSLQDDINYFREFIKINYQDNEEVKNAILNELTEANTSNTSMMSAVEKILSMSSNATQIIQFLSTLHYLSAYLP
jgi:parallel beta-helix repeat protein